MFRSTLIAALLLPACAVALTHSVDADGVEVTIYAPDWIWQRLSVNVLVVAKNNSGASRLIRLELKPPAGKENHFKFDSPTSVEFNLGAEETLRKAITDIYANYGFPRQIYDFTFSVRGQTEQITIPYPLRTVRGAAVTTAKSALYLPVIVALVWSVLFAVILPRMSLPGAWRRVQPAAVPAEDAANE